MSRGIYIDIDIDIDIDISLEVSEITFEGILFGC